MWLYATQIYIIHFMQFTSLSWYKFNYLIFLRQFTSFCLTEERMPFLISQNGCVHAYPPPLGFCVWAFGGGLAWTRCSPPYFFLFFYFFIFFCSRKNGFFIDIDFLYPLSIFAISKHFFIKYRPKRLNYPAGRKYPILESLE